MIFTTEADILHKAGENAPLSFATSGAAIIGYALQAESLISSTTRKDWSGAYASLSPSVKYILNMAASSKAAMMLINYDMSGFTSRAEAQTMLDVLRDEYNLAITELKDVKVKDFMTGVT